MLCRANGPGPTWTRDTTLLWRRHDISSTTGIILEMVRLIRIYLVGLKCRYYTTSQLQAVKFIGCAVIACTWTPLSDFFHPYRRNEKTLNDVNAAFHRRKDIHRSEWGWIAAALPCAKPLRMRIASHRPIDHVFTSRASRRFNNRQPPSS